MKNMCRAFIVMMLACFWTSCGEQKKTASVPRVMEEDTLSVDSLDELFFSRTEKKVFSNVDGIFDDFLSLFLSDEDLRDERINFPLPYRVDGHDSTLTSQMWKNSNLLPEDVELFTSIYEREMDMVMDGDTTLRSVRVELIRFDPMRVSTFRFSKSEGKWRLVALEESGIENYMHESFVDFYRQFATDSLFQSHHVQDPLAFITSDPEDEFNILEATIGREQWFAFRPALPDGHLMNINYTVTSSPSASRQRILQLKNIGTGSIVSLYFRLRTSGWMLVRFEDTSN